MARHALVPVDDLVLEGSRSDINRTYRNSTEILRGQGNSAGRGRCNPDGTPRKPEPPGGLLVSTAEVGLPGHSLNARMINIDIDSGTLLDPKNKEKAERLSQYQEDGCEGAYARTASACSFTGLHLSTTRSCNNSTNRRRTFRSDLFLEWTEHARTATTMGELLAAIEIFMEFLTHIGVLDENRFAAMWELAHDGLYAALERQGKVQAEEDPHKDILVCWRLHWPPVTHTLLMTPRRRSREMNWVIPAFGAMRRRSLSYQSGPQPATPRMRMRKLGTRSTLPTQKGVCR